MNAEKQPLNRKLDELDRQEAHLERLRSIFRDEMDDRKSSDNYAVAENEMAFELGLFSEPAHRETPDILDLVARTRRDAMASRLNSADILDRLDSHRKEMLQRGTETANILRNIYWITAINLGISIGVLGTTHPGWWRLW